MGQPGGQEAKDFLESIIGGQWLEVAVLIKSDTGRIVDRHGRMVAVPYLRQETSWVSRLMSPLQSAIGIPITKTPACRNVELEMVLNGWTWVLDRYGPDARYFAALEDAQRNQRGIWARADNVHPAEFKSQRYAEKRQRRPMPARQPTLFVGGAGAERCPADGCTGRIVVRTGKFGEFCGCSEFPKCRYSRNTRSVG
jgi:endonuclease YncB( thermonuclease family)